METIYDYNPTKEELRNIGVDDFPKEEYLSFNNQDLYYVDLAYLFYYRENEKEMRKFIKKVKSIDRKLSFWITISHP